MPLKAIGTLANRPSPPKAGWEYTSTDTSQRFTCFADGTWTEDPSSAIDAFSLKKAVRLATTGNLATLSGNQVVDGLLTADGDRILVRQQTAGPDNGLYTSSSGPWIRTTDADASSEVTGGMVVVVSEGTLNGNSVWMLTTDDPITLGTTALTFAKVSTVFGQDRQISVDTSRTTTTSTSFTAKVSLATPSGLNGTYRVGWSVLADNAGTGISQGEYRLAEGGTRLSPAGPDAVVFQSTASGARLPVGGWVDVVMVGAVRTFDLEFRSTTGGQTNGCQDARIELYRVN